MQHKPGCMLVRPIVAATAYLSRCIYLLLKCMMSAARAPMADGADIKSDVKAFPSSIWL